MKRILLVEDEESILDVLKLNLELEGYDVVTASTGNKAIEQFSAGKYHLVILDVMLPEMNGFDICKKIREDDQKVPVLFLTAKGTGEDRVTGLKLGADDYLTKPFNLEELLLRVKILIQRVFRDDETVTELADSYSFGNFSINFKTFEVVDKSGEKHDLTKREINLLKLLIERSNEVVSRGEILEKIWGQDAYPSTRTIDNYILVFRKYFEENPKSPRFFHSVRGVGYKFTP